MGLPPPPKSMNQSSSKPATNSAPPKGDLLAAIRERGGYQGAGLNKVGEAGAVTSKRPPSIHDQPDDLTAVLKQALTIIQDANR